MKLSTVFNKEVLFPLVLLLFGLIPIIFFLNGKLVVGGDEDGYMINAPFQTKDLYVWKTAVYRGDGLGIYDPTAPVTLGYSLPLFVLQKVGFSLSLAQGIYLTFWFLTAGLGMYYLVKKLFDFNRVPFNPVAGFASACLYLFNTYNIVYNWLAPSPGFLCAYASFPVMLAFFVRGLSQDKPFFSAFLLAFFSILVPLSSSNLALLALIWFTIFSFSLFFLLFKNRGKRRKYITTPFLFLFLYFVFNLWWIVPIFPFLKEGINNLNSGIREWRIIQSSSSGFLNLFRGLAHPGWFTPVDSRSVFPFSSTILNNPIIQLSLFFPLFFTILTLLTKKQRLKNYLSVLFFLIFYLLSLFFAKGDHSPLEFINNLFYRYLPGFSIFRSQVPKFGMLMIFSLAVCFGLSVGEVSAFGKKDGAFRMSGLIPYLFIFLAILPGYPFFLGEVIHSGKGTTPSFYHTIPAYYQEAQRWLDGQKEIFSLYSTSSGLGSYVVYDLGSNEKYLGVDIDSHIFTRPIVHARLPQAVFGNEREKAFKELIKNDFEGADLFFSFFNVKYLMLHKNDITAKIYGGYSLSESILKALPGQKNLVLEKQYGDLLFYRVKSIEK